MLCITSNKGICNVRFWSFLMHRACRLRGDWVWKRTSPLPKDWHIPGESWSDCWCLWWYCLNNGFKTGSYLKFQKWPVAQLSTRKSCKVSTDARNPFMKVKWDIKMLLEKAWGSSWIIGPQPISNEALAWKLNTTRLWPLNPDAVQCLTRKSSNQGNFGPSIRISWAKQLHPKPSSK